MKLLIVLAVLFTCETIETKEPVNDINQPVMITGGI